MSFASAFFSLTAEVNNIDSGASGRVRLKTPLHPDESIEHLVARFVTYIHSYRDGLALTAGLFEPRDPTVIHRDITGEILFWAQLGVPDPKKLDAALRLPASSELRVYFSDAEEPFQFASLLRGSKTNWVERIRFFMIPLTLLEVIAASTTTSSVWSATCVEDHLYLVCDGREVDMVIERVDIWAVFQQLIGNL
jgi:uncharacterized protein YaeQ